MTTNFYAIQAEDMAPEGRNLRHIGLTGSGNVIIADELGDTFEHVMMNAIMLPNFLGFEDECGEVFTTGQLIDHFNNYPMAARRKQYDYIEKFSHENLPNYYLDPQGFTMCAFKFC